MSAINGGICCVCRRRDDGLAYVAGKKTSQMIWACSDHIHLAKKVAHMPRNELDKYEQDALADAMSHAADKLEGMGTSDLFAMDEVQAVGFFLEFLDKFGNRLADRLEKLDPPF